MRFVSSISTESDTLAAVEHLLRPVDRHVTPGMVDLVFVYFTAHHHDDIDLVMECIGETFAHAVVLGCSAYGTIGCDREVERAPSMSLLAGTLPDVRICPFYLKQRELAVAESVCDWERIVGVSPESEPAFFAMADPFRVDVNGFVNKLNNTYPGAPLFGGVASAKHQPGGNLLVLNGEVFNEGVVGVGLGGNLKVQGVVSQGCRPIGKPYVITRGERNIIQELGGQAPLAQLEEMLSGLSEQDRDLARRSLLIGRAIDEYREEFGRGDFLIINITGADRRTGALGIAGSAKVGSTVQFHVRDAESADSDLREALAPHVEDDTKAALLFSCNGRGTHLYSDPHHDAVLCRERMDHAPLAGFFCGGEFGPVGGKNFVHGFTASVALFQEKAAVVAEEPQQAPEPS